MPISEGDLVVGGVYATANNQERQALKIEDGKVSYNARGGNVKSDWHLGHAINNPPSIKTFIEAVDHVISKPE